MKQIGHMPTHTEWQQCTKHVLLKTGIKMYYMEAGDPEKEPLILIHGFSDSSRIWRSVMEELQDSFHMYAIDLRGFGQSDQPAQYLYTMYQHCEDVVAFMEAMQIESADMIGHSLGSMVAQVIAFAAPEKVRRVVLVSTALRRHETAREVKEFVNRFSNMDWQNAEDKVLQQMMLPSPEKCYDPQFAAGYLMTLRGLSGKSLCAGKLGMMIYDGRNFMQFITAPVMVVWGTEDDIFTEECQTEVHEYLPEARYLSMEGIPHDIPSVAPLELVEAVKNFMSSSR